MSDIFINKSKKNMKTMIISEEEKNRILEMHKEATKKHYLGEQIGSAESQNSTSSPDAKKQLYNQSLNELNNKFLNLTEIKDIAGFNANGNVDEASKRLINNPKLLQFQINYPPVHHRYCSMFNGDACSGPESGSAGDKSIITYMLNDIIALRSGLVATLSERIFGRESPITVQNRNKFIKNIEKFGYNESWAKAVFNKIINPNFDKIFPNIKSQQS